MFSRSLYTLGDAFPQKHSCQKTRSPLHYPCHPPINIFFGLCESLYIFKCPLSHIHIANPSLNTGPCLQLVLVTTLVKFMQHFDTLTLMTLLALEALLHLFQ